MPQESPFKLHHQFTELSDTIGGIDKLSVADVVETSNQDPEWEKALGDAATEVETQERPISQRRL
jgi:hypothetical protein